VCRVRRDRTATDGAAGCDRPSGGWSARISRSHGLARGRPTGLAPRLTQALADHRRYEAQIDRLHERHRFDGGMQRLSQDGVSLASLVLHRGEAARKLSRAVAAGTYQLQPATIRRIRVDGKARTVFDFPLLDLIVHGVVADVIVEAVEPTLSPNLYSYRPGTSWADAVSGFARYVREHRRAHADPRSRGLYVLRRDVEAYTDSIPVDESSHLWSQLARVLGAPGHDAAVSPLEWHLDPGLRLLHDVVRPLVLEANGRIAHRDRGVPTGQPISVVAFDLYLSELDHELAAVPGAFVARYSDDLLVAHPDHAVARELSEILDQRLEDACLSFNPAKRQDAYLTGSGRASPDWSAARGTTRVGFLGMRVAMDGSVSLGDGKVRVLLRDARRRAANTARALDGRSQDERGRAVAAVINALLDPDRAHLEGAAAALLAGAVTDRGHLDWLDHELARIVATAVSGHPGAAAFRMVPYRRIRSEWGLISLRHARDRAA
jgi:hypothetical protein